MRKIIPPFLKRLIRLFYKFWSFFLFWRLFECLKLIFNQIETLKFYYFLKKKIRRTKLSDNKNHSFALISDRCPFEGVAEPVNTYLAKDFFSLEYTSFVFTGNLHLYYYYKIIIFEFSWTARSGFINELWDYCVCWYQLPRRSCLLK